MAKQPAEYASSELRTTAQACAQLGCSRWTLDRMCRKGKLERVRWLGQTRITARSLNALVDEMLSGQPIYQRKEKR
jgi:excisionase family DNA binding protein